MGQQPDETSKAQKARARQYAICTIALDYDGIDAGAEGVFDQALTNGLAAIVTCLWPGREVNSKGRVLSASSLLDVIEETCRKAADGVYYLPYERGADPEPEPLPFPISDDGDLDSQHHILVMVRVLREAIDATQAIRHARVADEDCQSPESVETSYATSAP